MGSMDGRVYVNPGFRVERGPASDQPRRSQAEALGHLGVSAF